MASLISPPGGAALRWDGQPQVKLGARTPGVVTIGQGLVGRTIEGQLYLDGANEAVADVVQLAAPGVVSARTIGKWRQRNAKGAGTLASLEANLATAPTVSGTATDYWRLVVTDSRQASIVLPLSTAGQGFYEIDMSSGQAIIDPWKGLATSNGAGVSGVLGARWGFVPNQGLSIGGFSVLVSIATKAFANPSTQLRGSLFEQRSDDTWHRLTDALVWTTASGSWGTQERVVFRFPLTIPMVAGSRYYVTVDLFEVYDGSSLLNLWSPNDVANNGGFVAAAAGTPADIRPAGPAQDTQIKPTAAANTGAANSLTAEINALTWEQIGISEAGAGTDAWTIPAWLQAFVAAGTWSVNGTTSGSAPVFGDLTFSLAAAGAPAAGTAGTDLNLRAVILP